MMDDINEGRVWKRMLIQTTDCRGVVYWYTKMESLRTTLTKKASASEVNLNLKKIRSFYINRITSSEDNETKGLVLSKEITFVIIVLSMYVILHLLDRVCIKPQETPEPDYSVTHHYFCLQIIPIVHGDRYFGFLIPVNWAMLMLTSHLTKPIHWIIINYYSGRFFLLLTLNLTMLHASLKNM